MPLDIGTEVFTPASTRQTTVTVLDEAVIAGSTATYVLPLSITGGGVIDNTDITSAKLTLYDEETKTVLNSRNNQDILGVANLGANNVVVSIISTFTWALQTADTRYVDPSRTKRLEWHRAVFTIVYNVGAGSETLIHELRFPVLKAFQAE